MRDSIYIFLHVPKTAGTTFNVHAEKNLDDKQALNFTKFEPTQNQNFTNQNIDNYLDLKRSVDKSLSKIPIERRSKYKLFYNTHFAYYGIHENFGKAGRYFTFVRNPARRVMSLYNYLSTLYFLEDEKGRQKKMYSDSLLIDGRYPDFEEWFEKKYGKSETSLVTMPMYKYFQFIGLLDGGKPSHDSIQKMYKKIFFVGTAKTFNEDSLYLYSLLGFDKFFMSQNVSIKYASTDEEYVTKLIHKKYNASEEIFEKGREYNLKFKEGNNDYQEAVSKLKLKKTVKTPFTQIVYDPRGTVGLASSSLRKNVPYYSRTLDYLKHNILK